MHSALHTSGYQAYLNGNIRLPDLPDYERVNNQVILFPGELYCRFRRNGILCSNDRPFAQHSSLRVHLRSHGLTPRRQGRSRAASEAHIEGAREWYRQFDSSPGINTIQDDAELFQSFTNTTTISTAQAGQDASKSTQTFKFPPAAFPLSFSQTRSTPTSPASLGKSRATMSQNDTLPPIPLVSRTTVPMAGFLVDVYGLEESPADKPVSCLWLLHPRGGNRDRMREIASRAVDAWMQHSKVHKTDRRLIALTFDMPNHGTRETNKIGNKDWQEGNENHGIDMVAMVRFGRADMSLLMDLVEGYVRRKVVSHMCLGWSLGGHSSWEAFFTEDRIEAAVVIIGSPNLMDLMESRAANSNLGHAGSFSGGVHFPPDLIQMCLTNDPKGILFGTNPVPSLPLSATEQYRLRPILDAHIRGKKLLLCSGAKDKLVPYSIGKSFIDVLKDAVSEGGWYSGKGVSIQDNIYEGVGHRFSDEMIRDSTKWLVETLSVSETQGKRTSHI